MPDLIGEFWRRITRHADRIQAMERTELELFLSAMDGSGTDLDAILASHDQRMARQAAAPEPPSVRAQAREDARQMWRTAFGTDPS
jgi:hypothetical protein